MIGSMKKWTFYFIFLFLAILPHGVSAQSAESLLQEINNLRRTIADLQYQLTLLRGGTGYPPAQACLEVTRNLRIGDQGADVQKLIILLSRGGFGGLPSNPASMAIFDERVASAVVEFQERYASEVLHPLGLSRGTGYVGAATRTKLASLYGCGVPTPPVPPPTPHLPVRIQTTLLGESGNAYGISYSLIGSSTVQPVYRWEFDVSCPSNVTVTFGSACGTNVFFPGPGGTIDGSIYFVNSTGAAQSVTLRARAFSITGLELGANSAIVSVPALSSGNAEVVVSSPNGGETFQQGQAIPVRWTSRNVPSNAVLELLLVKGTILHHRVYVTNDGTEPLNLPASLPVGGDYSVVLTYTGPVFTVSDRSDRAFTIGGAQSGRTITVTGPINSYRVPNVALISWNSTGITRVRIEACYDSRSTCVFLGEAVVSGNPSYFVWDIPAGAPYVGKNDVVIRVRDADNLSIFDDLDVPIGVVR